MPSSCNCHFWPQWPLFSKRHTVSLLSKTAELLSLWFFCWPKVKEKTQSVCSSAICKYQNVAFHLQGPHAYSNNVSLWQKGRQTLPASKMSFPAASLSQKESLISLFKQNKKKFKKGEVATSGESRFSSCAWISHPEHNCRGKQINKMNSNCNDRIQTDCSFRVRSLSIKRRCRASLSPSEGCRHFEHPAQWSGNEIH